MINYRVIILLFVYTHLCTLTYIQGNRFSNNNGSLIFIDSKPIYYDNFEDSLKFTDSDMANEYFRYCDESGSDYLSDNTSEREYGYNVSGCICCTTTLCLCHSVQYAINHTQNNTVIVMDNFVDIVSMGTALLYTQTTSTFENFTNLSLIGYNNATIDCNFLRSLHFKNCNNITIENITWINCGSDINRRPIIAAVPDNHNHIDHNVFYSYNYGIKLETCSSVNLKNCTFIGSKVGIFSASGDVHIDRVSFLSNAYNIAGDLTSMFTIISQADMVSNVTVTITNSLFSSMDNKGLLLFYIFADNLNPGAMFNTFIKDTNFRNFSI